jgi:hypothetical protein
VASLIGATTAGNQLTFALLPCFSVNLSEKITFLMRRISCYISSSFIERSDDFSSNNLHKCQ